VLLGESERKYKPYLKKLLGRYSFMRFRIWTDKDGEEPYRKIVKKEIKA
jgi:hypothetical protein